MILLLGLVVSTLAQAIPQFELCRHGCIMFGGGCENHDIVATVQDRECIRATGLHRATNQTFQSFEIYGNVATPALATLYPDEFCSGRQVYYDAFLFLDGNCNPVLGMPDYFDGFELENKEHVLGVNIVYPPSPTPLPPPPLTEDKSLAAGAIAGIICGVLAGLIILGVGAWMVWRRRRSYQITL